jgi:hypothetical protein
MSSQDSFSEHSYPSSPPASSLSVDQEQLQAKLARPRTCWVFNHMPDEDPETKYINQTNRRIEWRCKLSQHHDFEDVRRWWMEERQKRDFPNLSRMALDILSIPAMAADPERLFSSAGLTVTDRRNHLSIESIEALECIKSWVKL